jgi:hypothetical protein
LAMVQLIPVLGADAAVLEVSTEGVYFAAGQENTIRVQLENTGDYEITDIQAILSSSQPELYVIRNAHKVFTRIGDGGKRSYEAAVYVNQDAALGAYSLTLTVSYIKYLALTPTPATVTVPVGVIVDQGYTPKIKYTGEQSDIRLRSGTESQVRYNFVNNWDQPLIGLEFSLASTNGYMSIMDGVTYSVRALNSNGSVTLTPTISVLEGTPLGVYTVTATATYRDGDGNRYHQVFSLPLNLDEAAIARNTLITVASMEVPQQSVRPGDIFQVEIQVDCSGASAYEVMSTISFSSPSGISPLSPTTTVLGDLDPDETATVSYRLLAGGSIPAGQYPVTVTMTYSDSRGVSRSLSEVATVMVDALIDFELLDDASVVVYAGEQREMEADLLLVGTGSVQFVSVQLMEDSVFNQVAGSTEYVGAVDPDSPIPFDIDYRVADDAEPGIHDMSLKVQYRDHLNRVHEETLEYTVTVGQGARPESGAEQERGGIIGWLRRLFG